jgi:poly(3-hydroxybutyrate) depolymerase
MNGGNRANVNKGSIVRNIIVFSIVSSVLAWSAFGSGGTKVNGSFQSGGKTRDYLVYLPTGLPEHPPLVLGLHCLSGSPTQHEQLSGFDKIADREKFVIVYPQGIDKSAGSVGWDISTNMDEDFLLALIDTMAGRYKIDSNRVYSTGFSMGGMMSHKLACDVPDKIAAIGTASGYPLYGNDNCSPSRPVPICHTHGTSDKVVAYTGLEKWIAKFVKANGCPETPTTTNPTAKYKREYWGPCKEGSEIVVYHFDGMDHGYVDASKYGFSASDTFWTFFKKHPRNGATTIKNPNVAAGTASRVSAGYFAGKIHFKNDGEANVIRIFDVRGELVSSAVTSKGSVSDVVLPANSLGSGVHLIRVCGSFGSRVIKVIIP